MGWPSLEQKDRSGFTTWRRMLEPLLQDNGECLEDVIMEWGEIPYEDNIPVLSDPEELDREFYPGFGTVRGRPFVAYTSWSIYLSTLMMAWKPSATFPGIPVRA
ncbi:MAG: hypothetical protein OXH90_02930 [Paracoccaceae bacterium]|nr:hypothetical protein [Paracoccaceae bacterium]MDE2916540.1 hypothetical protein [Paracoccaceae bacterium]